MVYPQPKLTTDRHQDPGEPRLVPGSTVRTRSPCFGLKYLKSCSILICIGIDLKFKMLHFWFTLYQNQLDTLHLLLRFHQKWKMFFYQFCFAYICLWQRSWKKLFINLKKNIHSGLEMGLNFLKSNTRNLQRVWN